jgi:hypothetical protein
MATFSMDDDRECQVLQAADAAVFEVRRALNLSLKQWSGNSRDQFKFMQGRVMSLIKCYTQVQLLHIIQTHKHGEPFKLDVLTDDEIKESIKLVL